MNRVRVTNLQAMTPEEASSHEGAGYMTSVKPCLDVDGTHNAIPKIAETRRLAYRKGNDQLKMFVKFRFDLYLPHTSGKEPEGWDYDWCLAADESTYMDDAVAWLKDGWKFHLAPKLDMARWQLAVNGAQRRPVYYGSPNWIAKDWRISQFVMDIRHEAYQDLVVRQAVKTANLFSLDGFMMDCKMGWFCHGSPTRDTPESTRFYGGPIVRTSYAEGEFEHAYGQILRKLANENINPVLVTRPDRPQDGNDPWAWMPADLRELPHAEYI